MDAPEGLIEQQFDELLKPFNMQENDERVVRRDDGQINLRHEYIRTRLFEIYGPHGWGEQDLEPPFLLHGEVERQGKDERRVIVYRARQRLIIRNPEGGVQTFFDGVGVWGVSVSTNSRTYVWDQHSDAMNGARSVAFCRAAKSLGTQFGLSFYADNPEAFRVRYCLPRDISRQQAEERDKPEQPEMNPGYTQDPDEDPVSH